MNIDKTEIQHYGTKRHSGRYPWGSGKDYQKAAEFLKMVKDMKESGLEEKDIMTTLGISRAQLRSDVSWANSIRKEYLFVHVQRLKKQGLSNTEIGRQLEMSEASVRDYLSKKDLNKIKQLDNVAKALKEDVDKYEYLDVGVGVERQLGISKQKLKSAVAALKEEGYVEHDIYIKRLTDASKYTTVRVLTKESDLEVVKKNASKIRPPQHWTEDGGLNILGMKAPEQMDWNRIHIRYKEDGGEERDGTIQMRRNVEDLDLGRANYAQVRISVNGTHYLKGMALYADDKDMPKGKDIVFNTNKPKGTPKEKVLKALKLESDNPFGATITRQKGLINIVNEEGDWDSWRSVLSAQFLSKQELKLVENRIAATRAKIDKEYDEIMSIGNPVVKRNLLSKYEESLGSSSRHLKLLGFPNTKGHVILPFPDMKEGEVYAPNYKNGERVVLVRYPHGGTFELPDLVVNNKHKGAKGTIGLAHDAIGINPTVAQKLSGADFDGDTVYVIPNDKRHIKTSRTLPELKNFDPNIYQTDKQVMSKGNVQRQMGEASNLITDMTIKGASQQEIARAVRHSMVVIDAYKHKLDYKESARDNGIKPLKDKYQTFYDADGKKHVAASTLISRSKTQMDKVDNAHKLSSGTDVERAYANYANGLRDLQKKTQLIVSKIPSVKKNKDAEKKYAEEVSSLEEKLNTALLNAPKERQAQIMASNSYYKNLDPEMTKEEKRRLKAQALAGAREKTDASKVSIYITDKEWEAIENNAFSNDKLTKIIQNSDIDRVRQLATPKKAPAITATQTNRILAMARKGAMQSDIAEALGLTVDQVKNALL